MNEHSHEKPLPPGAPLDSESTALAEALRGSFAVVKVVMVVLVGVFLISGFFIVEEQEKAIILRFGKPVGEGEQALRSAGFHLAWPYPIDEVIRIPITEIQQVRSTVGWFAQTPEQEALDQDGFAGPSLNPAMDGYVLTADGNIAHSRATVRYRIDDPVRAVFGFTSGTNQSFTMAGLSNAVLNAANNALLHAAARFSVDQMLTLEKTAFEDTVRRRLEWLVQSQNLGIVVEQCQVQSREPRQLKEAFARVNIAGQNRSKVLNEALTYQAQEISRANAEAQRVINVAETDRTLLVASVRADADRFSKRLAAYERNPDLFMQQQLVEVMGVVLTNVQFKAMLPQSSGDQPTELRLLLNPETAEKKPAPTP